MTGGRDFTDAVFVWQCLDQYLARYGVAGMTLIHGDARGVDTFAAAWANERGVLLRAYSAYNPKYRKYGKSGPIHRNMDMYDTEQPDEVAAFPGGNGTKHMKGYARIQGCHVTEFWP